jgi:hypothetical protein
MMASKYRILLVAVFLIAGVLGTMAANKARNVSA